MIELTDDNYKTDRSVDDKRIGCWVFEVTENMDLYSFFFDSLEDAEAYALQTMNKCQILVVDRQKGFGDARVTVHDRT